MAPGSESISSNQNSVNSFVNGQVTSSEETKASAKASDASSTNSSSVSQWNLLSEAKSALVSVRDAISNSLPGVDASAPTSTVTRAPATTYDDAKTNFDTAKSGLQSATTLADYERYMGDLNAALQDMERLQSTTDQQNEVTGIKQNLQAKQDVISQLNRLVAIENQNKTLLDDLITTDSWFQLPAMRDQFTMNKNSAEEIVNKLQGQNLNYNDVLTNAKEVITESSDKGTKQATALQEIVDEGNRSQAAVQSALQNNSPDNIEACKKIIDDAEAKIAKLKQDNPDIASSIMVSRAEEQVAQAKKDIQDIKPSGSDIPIVGPDGSGSSAGRAAGAMKTSSRSGRISSLLDDADNEMASTIMQGFRSMIEQFDVSNPATAKELQAMDKQLETLSDQLADPAAGMQAEDLATVLGQVAFAAAQVGGGSSGTAGIIQTNVKQLYNTAFSSSSGKSYESALSKGYSAYKTLSSVYSESRSGVQSVINQTANPALSRTVSRSGIEPQGRSTDSSRRAAETIVRDSSTLGDVYGRLQVLDSLMGIIASNPQDNQEAIMQKLSKSIDNSPSLGSSSATLQKFAAKLEQEFIDGERNLVESKENAFRRQPAFIQQVLVNIASLFSGYLS
jgi:hypothetical protein